MKTQRFLTVAFGGVLTLAMTVAGRAQGSTDQPPPPQQQQQGPSGPMTPDMQLERISQQLNLTTDQQAQIRPLLVARQQKLEALLQDKSISPQEQRTQAMAIVDATRDKILALLTVEQKQKIAAMRAQMNREGQNGQSAPPPPPAQQPPPPPSPQAQPQP